jgi:hypothetical protein
MRESTLPSPGVISMGHKLRREAASAISFIEIVAARTPGGKTRAAASLATFFTACATALDDLKDATAPTMAAIDPAVATSATQINLTFAEAMDTSVTPAAAAFSVNNGGTVTTVAWVSGVLRLTGTGYAAADVVTYTKPATNFLRDLAGNAVASGTKAVA